ncbi:hypothetical protein [Parafrankia sp. FMc2]
MTVVPRPIMKGRQIAGLLLVVTTAAMLVLVVLWVAWSMTRPPTL